jgi:hypothetical protein
MSVHHIAEYNNKQVSMDYIKDPKEQFRFACMRIIDNGFDGIVICPNGDRYEVIKKSRKAKLIK